MERAERSGERAARRVGRMLGDIQRMNHMQRARILALCTVDACARACPRRVGRFMEELLSVATRFARVLFYLLYYFLFVWTPKS